MSTATWGAARRIAGTLGGRSTVLGSFGASETDRQHLLALVGLDREVDKAFGAPRKLTTECQRQELLFENYSKLTS